MLYSPHGVRQGNGKKRIKGDERKGGMQRDGDKAHANKRGRGREGMGRVKGRERRREGVVSGNRNVKGCNGQRREEKEGR